MHRSKDTGNRQAAHEEEEQCRWRRCEEVYNHALSSSEVEWILIHSTFAIQLVNTLAT